MRAREREGEHLLPPPPRQGTCQSEGREDGSQTRLRGNDGKEGRETCRYHPLPQERDEHPGYCQMLPLRHFHRTTRQEIFRTIKRTPPPGMGTVSFVNENNITDLCLADSYKIKYILVDCMPIILRYTIIYIIWVLNLPYHFGICEPCNICLHC